MDAAGVVPFVNRINLILIGLGAVLALWHGLRRPEYAAVLILTLAVAFGPVWVDGAWYRRTIGLTPFLALFAALPLALVWRQAANTGGKMLAAAAIGIAAVIGGTAALDITRYFTTYDEHRFVTWVFRADFYAALEYLETLPDGTFVNYYGRHDYQNDEPFYEDRLPGINRTEPFDPTAFVLDRSQNQVFVFAEDLGPMADEVAEIYPGGEHHDGGRLFQAYWLPRSE